MVSDAPSGAEKRLRKSKLQLGYGSTGSVADPMTVSGPLLATPGLPQIPMSQPGARCRDYFRSISPASDSGAGQQPHLRSFVT